MSHVVTVAGKITDLDALEVAVAKFNAQLVRDAKEFTFYSGAKAPCAAKITFEGAKYEVGLRPEASSEAAFTLHCDFWDGSLAKKFGANLVGLRNEYQATVAERAMQRRGFRVRREVSEANHVRLVALQ